MSQIGFANTPSNILVPFFYAEFASGQGGGLQNQNSLIIANTITAQPAVPVWCPSVNVAITLFGAGSVAAQMVERYLTNDPTAALYVLPLADDGAGVAATGNISFTGPASAAGTLALYIGGKSVPVAVTSGMTASQLATAVVAAANAWRSPLGTALQVTAAVDGSNTFQANFTAKNKGTHGNSIDIRLNYFGLIDGEATPAGIVATVTPMASGATDPALAAVDGILGNTNYDFIAVPWSTTTQLNSLGTLMNDTVGRWSYNRQDYGHVFAAKMDADATGATNIAFGAGRNDRHVTVVSYEPSPSTPWEVAAGYMGAAAVSLRADPNRPLQTLAIQGLLAPLATGRYTWATKNTLLGSGMALMSYSADGNCAIRRCVTTYQKNGASVVDASYRDAETLFALMFFIRAMKSAVGTAFPRAKLADDGVSFGAGNSFSKGQADQPITTPKGIKSILVAAYDTMVGQGVVEDTKTFREGLIVQRNANDSSRVDVLLDPIIVSGLRVVATLTTFYLSDAAALAAA